MENVILDLISEEGNFFSSMKGKEELGKIIEIANRKNNYKEKAEEFLRLKRKTSEKILSNYTK